MYKGLRKAQDTPTVTRGGYCPQGTGNPAQAQRDANDPDTRENEVEGHDSAVQSMRWGPHCLRLRSVVGTAGRVLSLAAGPQPMSEVVLNETTVVKD